MDQREEAGVPLSRRRFNIWSSKVLITPVSITSTHSLSGCSS